ncbi:MAG: ribose 5-phosphate isomerase [Solirubrobacteraceae bacterium]|jgi:ribose 5-phosphate isomerase A|nr:ribose 5-phosphate isomerase [Solirubrobacteraceae bacterium]
MSARVEHAKRDAGEAAALLVEPGMRVGLGTGSTVSWFLEALARRKLPGLRCVATSPATARRGAELGLPVEEFDTLDRLDLTVDGADQVAPDGWLVKGGGGAHLREKIAATAADRFVVIVDADKLVDHLVPPVPLEIHRFGLSATLAQLGSARVREGAAPSPDGGVIADLGDAIDDPAALAARLDAVPGVLGHGLFSPGLVDEVVVGGA